MSRWGSLALGVSLALTALAVAQDGPAPAKAPEKPPPTKLPEPEPKPSEEPKPPTDDALNLYAWPIFESIQEGDRKETTILGFYNSVTSPEHRKLRVSPFYSYEWDKTQDLTRWDVLWPLISHEQRAQATETAVRPLYWSRDDPARGQGYNHLFPLWYSEWTKDESTLVTLPGWVYARRGDRHIVHMWPFFGRHDLEDGGTRYLSLGHAVWFDTGRGDSTGNFAALPLGTWANWSPESAITVSLPLLFGRGRIGDESWWASIPFAAGRHTPTLDQVVTIPYAYTRDQESTRHDVLFPLFTKQDRHDGSRSELSVRPLFWYDRSPEATWTLAPPLFHTYDSKELSLVWTIPYAYTRDQASTRHDVLFPFFTKKDSHDGTRSELSVRPLFWYDRSPARTYAVAPPFFYSYADAAVEQFWSLPYLYNKDAERTRHDVLFPLFTKQDSHDGTRSELSVRPLFWYDRTPERTWTLAPPFFHTYESKDVEVLWTIPYAYTRDRESTRHDVLFPLFTKKDSHDGTRSELSVRPLFWYDSTPERTHTVAAPLFYDYSDANGNERFWSLPYLYNKDTERTRHDVLFPLFTKQDSHDGERSELSVRPLFWYDRTPERTWTLAPPFFHTYESKDVEVLWTIPYAYTRDRESTRHDVLFPLFTKQDSHDGTRSELSVRPLFWYDSTPERTHTVAAPLFYDYSDANGNERFWSLPYLYNKDQQRTRHDVLFPLFTKQDSHDGERSELSVRPFFWYDRTPERTYAVSPLFYSYADEELERFWSLPYLYNKNKERERHDVLFPLFTAKFGVEEERTEVSLRPLFWYDRTPERTWTVAPPFFLSYESPEESLFWTIPYSYTRKGDDVRHDFIYPFVSGGATDDGESAHFYARPFFWYDRTPERTYMVAPPLFYSYSDEDVARLWSLPYLYNRDAEGSRHDVLFPLFTAKFGAQEERSEVSLRPLFWYDRTPERTWTLAPPFFHTYESDELDLVWTIPYAYTRDQEKTRHDVLFPLFTASESHDGESSSVSLRPFFWYDRNPQRTYTAALPLFYSYESETVSRLWSLPYLYNKDSHGSRHDVLFPLFTAKESADGESSSVSLRPLFWYDTTPERTYMVAPPLFYSYESERVSRFWSLPYLYNRDSRGSRHDVLFPLFTAEESADGESSSVSLRPLFWYDREPERTITTAPPLFYSYESEELSRFWTIPYAYTRDQEETRHDVLFPLFTASSSHDGESAEVSFRPLFWYDRSPEATWTLAFPLFHTYDSDDLDVVWTIPYAYTRDRDTTRHDVLFPLFTAKSSDDGERSELSFRPLFWYDDSPERTYTFALPLFWSYFSEQFSNIVTPLYMQRVDRKNQKTQRVVFPLYWEWEEGERSSRTVLPLYWDLKDKDSRAIQLWPFFGWSHDGDYEQYSTLWPLVAWGSGGDRGHSRFLPLWYYGREAKDWHLEVLWPVFHAEGDGERATWSALHSLARYSSQGDDYDFRVLWWLYRLRQEGDRYDNMFLPLWWHSAEGQEENLWILYPLLEYENGPKGGQLDVFWKLFTYDWGGEDEQEWRLFYKFLHYKRKGDAGLIQVNPFFSYEWEGDDKAMFQIFGGAYYRQKKQGEWRSGGLWGAL